ncbi:mutS protein homolog 5-like [Thrips palmi]|uniref:MutS protein homolog 5-like n=1 Tax=Thrips palmi TaxID=161013 RepID=A0A6P8Z761_THRPL|nr:mutS protein homolog 5-like [Thrips palmi]
MSDSSLSSSRNSYTDADSSPSPAGAGLAGLAGTPRTGTSATAATSSSESGGTWRMSDRVDSDGESSSSGAVGHPNGDDGEDDPETSDTDCTDRDEVILSVFWKNGKLGGASYSLQNPVVYLLNDIADDFHLGFKVLQSLFLQVQPTQVLTCKTMPHRFILLLNNLLIGEMESSDETLHGNFHVLPDAEFRNNNSLRQVFNLKLPGEPEDLPEEEHKQFIRSLIDTSQDSMINALARLLKYLTNNLAWLCLSHAQSPILGLRNLCIEQQVWINSETYHALQIFTHTAHPSLFKWTPDAHKEGFSIFGLLNRCNSKLGSKFLRGTMLQPTTNIQELTKRHEVIRFCMDPAHEDVVKKMQECIRQVQSISGMLPRLFAAQATIAQWKSLRKTNHNILRIREICSRFSNTVPFFEKARSVISDDLYRVGHLMDQIIDFQTSEQTKQFCVLPGVDNDLDKMKHTYANLSDMMMELSPMELQDLPDYIPECSVTFLPEIGFLLSIAEWKNDLSVEEMHLPGFKYKFTANNTIYYKSPRCRELDSSLGDIFLRISELELRIMLRLVQYIQQRIDSLLDSMSYVGELDCLIALASVAREYGYVKPTMTTGHEILIEKGRHPLQECYVSNYVPNNTSSNSEHGLVKILTGPNASGKSVYLKQVAVIAYLAHTGSFVPARKAVIGVLDQIHTRIQTTESAASQLSAFVIDLRQMNTAVCMSTKSSLLVIDEFGKGTSEVDGLSLLAAFLNHLTRRGPSNCPHVILSTHFHRLIDLIEVSPLVKAQVLEHIVSDGELVYLYQLKSGQIKSSLAIEVAKANGIPDQQINRAQEVLNALKGGLPIKPISSHKKMHLSKTEETCVQDFSEMTITSDQNIDDIRKTISNLK